MRSTDGSGSDADRRKLEQDLLATVKELRDVKAALDEHSIVAITDPAGKITYVNDKFCAISKYSREELIGQDHRIINSRHHPKEFFRDLWTTIGHGKVWHGEIKNRAKDGIVLLGRHDHLSVPQRGGQAGAIRRHPHRHHAAQGRRGGAAAIRRGARGKKQGARSDRLHGLARPALAAGQRPGLRQAAPARLRDDRRPPRPRAKSGAVPAAQLKQPVEVAIPQALRFINAGVAKMESLLAGLLRYSRLGRVALTIRPLNMNGMLAEILAAMKFQLDEAKAEVRVDPLPVCEATASRPARSSPTCSTTR